jgi:WXXGXW repeat (2 copies)
MRIIFALPLLVPAVAGLSACEAPPPPQTTRVVVQAQPAAVVPAAPMPPPPPMSELVPPPPPSATPPIWQPGHWRYTGIAGNPWSWQGGQYVALPPGVTAWVPGQWQEQGGGWVWREGHWAA